MVVSEFITIAFTPVVLIASNIRPARQPQTGRNMIKDVNAVVHTTKDILTRSHGEYWYIGQTVHTLVCIGW